MSIVCWILLIAALFGLVIYVVFSLAEEMAAGAEAWSSKGGLAPTGDFRPSAAGTDNIDVSRRPDLPPACQIIPFPPATSQDADGTKRAKRPTAGPSL